jgi:hypothetical protein
MMRRVWASHYELENVWSMRLDVAIPKRQINEKESHFACRAFMMGHHELKIGIFAALNSTLRYGGISI